jgi:putative transposase
MRKARILMDGCKYHITARINRKEMILQKPIEKMHFLKVVSQAQNKYNFTLQNFCIMDNHIHFILFPKNGASLSAIMRWILGVFAIRYNKRHGISGHVWGDRFFSRIINSFREFIVAFDYIDNNPIKIGTVCHPSQWPFGGFWYYYCKKSKLLGDIPDYVNFASMYWGKLE